MEDMEMAVVMVEGMANLATVVGMVMATGLDTEDTTMVTEEAMGLGMEEDMGTVAGMVDLDMEVGMVSLGTEEDMVEDMAVDMVVVTEEDMVTAAGMVEVGAMEADMAAEATLVVEDTMVDGIKRRNYTCFSMSNK